MGEQIGKSLIKERLVWQDLGNLACSRQVSSLTRGAKFGKSVFGVAGTVGCSLVDAGGSIAKEEYVGACIDVGAGAAGIGAGYVIGLGATFLVATFALPAIGVAIGAFAVGVVVGVGIDFVGNVIKDEYYGR